MTKEQIDRVKDAIRKEIGKRHQGLPRGGWDGLMEKAAIAAIEAMRDPTPEMIRAAKDWMVRQDIRDYLDYDDELMRDLLATAFAAHPH